MVQLPATTPANLPAESAQGFSPPLLLTTGESYLRGGKFQQLSYRSHPMPRIPSTNYLLSVSQTPPKWLPPISI